ncbi:MAG TPA: SsrA-binding protein SmpB [Rickettsiales bacterium]|nr:SsrA-binding protein SmpB [Rickettsiales bacterium]
MKIIAQNRKAYYNYTIEEEIEAGIMLLGSEVKSIRDGRVNINDAYAAEIKGEIFLVNSSISQYKGSNRFNHEVMRQRKLLLHSREMAKILGKMAQKGYSLIPLKIYFNKRNIVKILLGMAKGKKLYDKRESIKKRDEKRSQARGEE